VLGIYFQFMHLNKKLEASLVGCLLVLMGILGYFQYQKSSTERQLNVAGQEYLAFLKQAQFKAVFAEKISGKAPDAYGVLFENKTATVFADWNKNNKFDLDEQVEIFQLNPEFDYTFHEPLILFKTFQKINGVCFADDCDGKDEESLITEIKNNQQVKKVYIERMTGEINID
jgi:hypothetical protein